MHDQWREAPTAGNFPIHVISRRPLIVELAGSSTEAECGLLLAAAQQYPIGPSDRIRAIGKLLFGLGSELEHIQKVNSDPQIENKKLQQQLDAAFRSCPHTPKQFGQAVEEIPSSSDPLKQSPSPDSTIGPCVGAVAKPSMQEHRIPYVDSDSDECVNNPSESDDAVRQVSDQSSRASLLRSTTMANSHEDDFTREQKVNKLQGCFKFLVLDGNEGLLACQLQSIVQRVHGLVNRQSFVPFWGPPEEAMSIAHGEIVIEQLLAASTHHVDNTVEVGTFRNGTGVNKTVYKAIAHSSCCMSPLLRI